MVSGQVIAEELEEEGDNLRGGPHLTEEADHVLEEIGLSSRKGFGSKEIRREEWNSSLNLTWDQRLRNMEEKLTARTRYTEEKLVQLEKKVDQKLSSLESKQEELKEMIAGLYHNFRVQERGKQTFVGRETPLERIQEQQNIQKERRNSVRIGFQNVFTRAMVVNCLFQKTQKLKFLVSREREMY